MTQAQPAETRAFTATFEDLVKLIYTAPINSANETVDHAEARAIARRIWFSTAKDRAEEQADATACRIANLQAQAVVTAGALRRMAVMHPHMRAEQLLQHADALDKAVKESNREAAQTATAKVCEFCDAPKDDGKPCAYCR